MKNKTNKTSILTLCLIALSFATQAQFPNFIKVDTGAITQLWGGHISSTCFDMDNDGDLDIACSNSGVGINRIFSIYRNERNGFYTEVPEFNSNLDFNNIGPHGDIDNDGDVDIITGMPYIYLGIFPNHGYGNYTYSNTVYMPASLYYPILLDLNNDGSLDLVGINEYGCVSYNSGNGEFMAWENLGYFHDQELGYLHGVSWGDVDDDGDMDLYGGYSGTWPRNKCFLNNGNGGFELFDSTSVITDNLSTITQSLNWLDYDNDGDMDLFILETVSGYQNEGFSAIYENLGDMQFERHMIGNPIYNGSFTMSSVWGDLDNDADLDLYLTVENNENPWIGGTSATPYNILYLNDGNGEFTGFLGEHPLVTEDSHTAMLLDHDNDGDLDVLMTRYSWEPTGYNNLYNNEGNHNSWIVLTCEGTTSNRSAIGTRIQAKGFVNGNHIIQTREITPINGHLSYANLRVHLGLGDADVIDTLIIRWPSGIIDTYLDVEGNQFYRAIENEELIIEYKATNYISYNPGIIADSIYYTTNIDLNEHFHLVVGDTLPPITGDTLLYSVYNDSNPGIVLTEITENTLTIEPLEIGETTIEIMVSAGFTEKLVSFIVNVVYVSSPCLPEGIIFSSQEEIDNYANNHPYCPEIEGGVTISGNDITNLHGLNVLNVIGGNLEITGNDILVNLSGLNNLSFIGASLTIKSNDALTSLTGLENLTYLEAGLFVGNYDEGNPSLINLSGLNNLVAVAGPVVILGNSSLTSLTGLDNLSGIVMSLWIEENINLTGLSGLSNLTYIGGELVISNNLALNSLIDLDNLTAIEGYLSLSNNIALESLTGLENIDANTITELYIVNNDLLSDCDVQSICEYLADPIGNITISLNAPGCNSQQEVEDACWTSVHDISLNEHLTISPNPNSGFVTLNYTVSEPGILLFKLFDLTGTKVKSIEIKESESGIHELEIDLRYLPAGIYFCTLKTNPPAGGQTTKMIKL